MKQNASGLAMHYRKSAGVRLNFLQCRLNRRQKLLPQAGALTFVPLKRIVDVGSGGGTDEDGHYRVRRRMR